MTFELARIAAQAFFISLLAVGGSSGAHRKQKPGLGSSPRLGYNPEFLRPSCVYGSRRCPPEKGFS
jgi:hypothetical protein